jgi:GntR family transcriptional regulator
MVDLSKAEGIPLYVKIREALRQEITDGTLQRGEKILSEDLLAEKYNVSRMTVRQGIADLIDEGYLYRRHGVGTFVAFPHVERDHSRLTNFFEISESKGIHAWARVLSVDVIPAKQRVAKALDLGEGEKVIRIQTLRFTDIGPVTVHDAHVPYKLFAHFIEENLEVQRLWSLFEQCGYKVKRAVQRLEARDAGPELARLLQVDECTPILYKERTVYAEDGTPVEFTYCYNRGDMYSLTVTLER